MLKPLILSSIFLMLVGCQTTTVGVNSTRTASSTEITRENTDLPRLIRLQAHNVGAGNFDKDADMEFFAVVSPPEYNRLLWGPDRDPDKAYAQYRQQNWSDQLFFTDANGKRTQRQVLHTEGFCLHAQSVVPANFNNDGTDDIAVFCQGFDAKPFPGAHSYVLLSQPDGTFRSKRLTERTGFYHDGTIMDVNGDGNLDVLTLDSFTGALVAHFGDGAGKFPSSRKLLSAGIWPHAVSSYDFDGDGSGDLIIGGNEIGGRNQSQQLLSKIYFNDGRGGFSKARSGTLPVVEEYGRVLDFVVAGSTLFVLRTNMEYSGGAIQRVDLTTMAQTGLYARPDVPHPNKLRPVLSRSGRPTFSDLSVHRVFFDFSIDENGDLRFLNR